MEDMAPYFQGYLSAARLGTHMRSWMRFINMPKPIYPERSNASNAWHQGVSDRIDDRMPCSQPKVKPPVWRLI